MFIFVRGLRSSAAVTPAKYELDIIQVTTVFIIRKNCENNGTEKIGLVTPTPGLLLQIRTIGISLLSYKNVWDMDVFVIPKSYLSLLLFGCKRYCVILDHLITNPHYAYSGYAISQSKSKIWYILCVML